MVESAGTSLTEHQRKWLQRLQACEESLQRAPFSEQLFVFCNRRRDKVKILYWERSGLCMWQKRLEKARFKWPRRLPMMSLCSQQ